MTRRAPSYGRPVGLKVYQVYLNVLLDSPEQPLIRV